MSKSQFEAFIKVMKSDVALQEKLKADTSPEAVLAVAKAAGFVFSTDCLQESQQDVSEQELESAAGGKADTIKFLCTTCIPSKD